MNLKRWLRRTLPVSLLGLALLAICGCGENALESTTAKRLKGLTAVFLDYAVARGNGPADEKTLRKHFGNVHDVVLSLNDLDRDHLDDAFVSDRDHEPFVIHYGVGITVIGGPDTPMVAHEKTGMNGRRLVAFADGQVQLVEDARFQELTKPK